MFLSAFFNFCSLICVFVLFFGCVFVLFCAFGAFRCFFVPAKSFRKKNKKNKRFKTVLMTSFILLLKNTCINKIENITTFKIKTGYYLDYLSSEMMKLLGSMKSKRTKEKNRGKCTLFRNG